MDFIKFSDPIFQYISLLKSDVADESITYVRVREDVRRLLENMKKDVSAAPHEMSIVYNAVYLPLLCFIDYKISNSGYSFSAEWDKDRLAYSEACYTGDKKFFLMLDEVLADRNNQNDNILMFYYVCLKLGFQGIYVGDDDKIENYLWELEKRLRLNSIGKNRKFSSSVYENILESAPLKSDIGFWKRCACMGAALLGIYLVLCFILYYYSTNSFVDVLNKAGILYKNTSHLVQEDYVPHKIIEKPSSVSSTKSSPVKAIKGKALKVKQLPKIKKG